MSRIRVPNPPGTTLEPEDVQTYLTLKGWRKEDDEPGVRSVWQRRGRWGQVYRLLLPLDKAYGDYSQRFSEALQAITQADGITPQRLAASIALARSDVTRIVALQDTDRDGSIPLAEGLALVEGARNLHIAGACAAIETKAYYGPRKPKEAEAYTARLRLGQTERGSYVLTVISRLTISDEDPGTTLVPDTVVPFERRVTNTLARALQSAEAAASIGEFREFVLAVPKGVSADLCDAIVRLGEPEAIGGLRFDFAWAPALPQTGFTPPSVKFPRDLLPPLREASERFRRRDTFARYHLVGNVTRLARQEGSADGIVTIEGRVGDQVRPVRIELSNDRYDVAIVAHREHRMISCFGDIAREGRDLWMRNVSDFHLLGVLGEGEG